MKAIYIRVSTASQSIETQLKKENPELKPFIDICSGSVPFFERSNGKKLMNSKMISSIQIREVSRLGRNLKDILNTIEHFTEKGVDIYIENQGLHTILPNGKVNPSASLIIALFGAVAQQERDLLRERTLIGVAIAKSLGNYKGRKRGAISDILKKEITLINALQFDLINGLSITKIALKHSVTRQKIYDWIKKGLIKKRVPN